jgi:hypothetical protein
VGQGGVGRGVEGTQEVAITSSPPAHVWDTGIREGSWALTGSLSLWPGLNFYQTKSKHTWAATGKTWLWGHICGRTSLRESVLEFPLLPLGLLFSLPFSGDTVLPGDCFFGLTARAG